MAYNLAVNDIIRVSHACFQGNQLGINTVFYQVTAVAGASLPDFTVADQIDALVQPLYRPLLGSNSSYFGTRLSRVLPGPTTLPATVSTRAAAGTAATTCQGAQVSGIIKATTVLAGPSQRARLYIPFPAIGATDIVTNVPTVAYKNALTALGGMVYSQYVLNVGLNGCTIVPVVFHRASRTTSQITASGASAKWATQKRRGNYGRVNAFPPF